MKRYLNMLLVALTISLIANCEDDGNPIGPDNDEFVYPLTVGNQWEYTRTFSLYNVRPNTIFGDTTVTSSVIMKVIGEKTIHDSINTFGLQETLEESNMTIIDSSYYANLDDGLYLYAYRGSGSVAPKASHGNRILFKGRYFNSIREITSYITKVIPENYVLIDSLIYEIPPLQSLKYPIRIRSQWTYRHPGKPWRIDKKILNYERIRVPAGSFRCYRIQWLYDIDHNGVWDNDIVFYDYVCEKGLIKKIYSFQRSDYNRRAEPRISWFNGKQG